MKIKLKKDKKYILTFDIGNNILNFTVNKIINDLEDSIEFEDKFGEIGVYDKKYLISVREVR